MVRIYRHLKQDFSDLFVELTAKELKASLFSRNLVGSPCHEFHFNREVQMPFPERAITRFRRLNRLLLSQIVLDFIPSVRASQEPHRRCDLCEYLECGFSCCHSCSNPKRI